MSDKPEDQPTESFEDFCARIRKEEPDSLNRGEKYFRERYLTGDANGAHPAESPPDITIPLPSWSRILLTVIAAITFVVLMQKAATDHRILGGTPMLSFIAGLLVLLLVQSERILIQLQRSIDRKHKVE